MHSWQRSLIAVTVILAFGIAALTTCVEGAMSTEMQQMACCKNGNQDCASDVGPADCCKHDTTKHRDVINIAKIDLVQTPVAVMVQWAAIPDAATLDSAHRPIAYAPSPPIPPTGPPPYIAFSTLLI